MAAKIITVGAGKGGVGKSFISSSLGITMAKLNRSVLLVDFDLGGANLHTQLGIAPSSPSLLSFLEGKAKIASLIKPTSIPHLSFVQGCWEGWEISNCAVDNVRLMIHELRELPYDFVILDLGAGATPTHLEIFKNSDEKILVTTPEPTSIEKTYRFLESWVYFEVSFQSTPEALRNLKAALQDFRSHKKEGHFSFRDFLAAEKGFSLGFFETLRNSPMKLIVNCSRSHVDQQIGYSIKSVCRKYFDLPVSYIGPVDYDNAVWHSIRNREPFLIAKPFTSLSGQFLSLSRVIIDGENSPTLLRAVI
jgi:flagellar biosynthesis protein FlhG